MNYRKHTKIIILFFTILLATNISEARQGCCSHHGGVCGCQCCDGTSLSTKCAPYYPCGGGIINNDSCKAPILQTKIINVVDGDTVDFICENKKYRVRIIGINTPETVHPNKPIECFGKEASEKMRNLVLNKTVTLKISNDHSQDKYGRLLRYIILNGEDIGSTMIKEGYAFSYKRFSHDNLELYNEFEQKAKATNTGLWNDKKCNY